MRISINVKALGAFRKLGAVALITATIFFTACNQTGGGSGTPKPKHAITFSVDSTTPNGTLKAKADGVPETSTSPINIEEGKTVTFTAKANDGYRVKGWTLDGKPITEAGTNTEYKLKVSKPATVKVSFEAIPPTKYTVTLTQTEGGTVTALPEIPADKLMPKDTEITFTAKADDGYKVDKWTVTPAEALQAGTGADGSETAKVKITANTTVSVSFTKKTYAVTFSVDSTTPNGTLTAKVDGGDIASGKEVEEGKEVIFTAKADDGYRVKGWTLDGKPITEAGTNTEYKLTVTKVVTVKVSFEAIPPTKYTVTLTQTANGTVTPSSAIPQDGVDKDTVITFTATAESGYRVNTWAVTPSEAIQSGGKKGETTATLKITANTTVSVSFTKKTYAVNFSVAGTGGTLKAEGDGITQPATSPITVEHGKEVIFTAKADAGYKIGKWTVTGSVLEGSTGADGSPTAKVKITADTTVSVSFEVTSVEGGAVLILSPDKLTIEVRAVTADNSAITVEGCTVTTFASNSNINTLTELHATGTTVILKGKITELYCRDNKLTELNVQGLTALQRLVCGGNKFTELNVQGCTSLQKLNCSGNKLNAQAMTELLNALPAREAGDNAMAVLYTEFSGEEGNCKDYTQPEDLKKAFDGAKSRKWNLGKQNANGIWEWI